MLGPQPRDREFRCVVGCNVHYSPGRVVPPTRVLFIFRFYVRRVSDSKWKDPDVDGYRWNGEIVVPVVCGHVRWVLILMVGRNWRGWVTTVVVTDVHGKSLDS